MPPTRRVLIVEDDRAFAQLLVQRCAELGLAAETASDGLEALLAGLRNPPDLFILDVRMPGTDGLTVCEKIVADDHLKNIPVIILTGSADEELIRRCRTLGASYCHKGLEVWHNLKPLICGALNIAGESAKPTSPRVNIRQAPAPREATPKLLVVDDDPHVTKAMSIRLGALGIDVIQSADVAEAEKLAHNELPDVIVTDFHMPGMSGERLLLNLKKFSDTRNIPVIVITGDRVDGQPNYALKREFLGRWGADAYFGKPLDFDAFLKELKRHIRLPEPPAAASQRG